MHDLTRATKKKALEALHSMRIELLTYRNAAVLDGKERAREHWQTELNENEAAIRELDNL